MEYFSFLRVLFLSLFIDVVLDAGNMVAKESVEAAKGYLEKNSGALVGTMSMVEVEGSEAYVTVEKGWKYQ